MNELNVVIAHALEDANSLSNRLLSGFSLRSCMLCVGTKRSSGTGNRFKNERAWKEVTIALAQIKNCTIFAEFPFLFSPRRILKEALIAG